MRRRFVRTTFTILPIIFEMVGAKKRRPESGSALLAVFYFATIEYRSLNQLESFTLMTYNPILDKTGCFSMK
jgi:hypothetical protein